jgi:hypothetical protein
MRLFMLYLDLDFELKLKKNDMERLPISSLEAVKQEMLAEGVADEQEFLEIYDKMQKQVIDANILIEENIYNPEASQELEACLELSREFCEVLSKNFQAKFQEILVEYKKNQKLLSDKIIDFLKEKELDLPKFALHSSMVAEELLDNDLGLEDYNGCIDYEIKNREGKIIIVFNLPKPLAQFWWKGGTESWGSAGADIEASGIEWGDFYRELMPTVWETQGLYANEKGLNFERINFVADHKPDKYYYIWQVSVEKSKNLAT